MSVYNLWDKEQKEPKLKSTLSAEWNFKSPMATPRSSSPPSRVGEAIFNDYIDLVNSKSNISADAKQTENLDRPFDFFDDEEFAFGINLLNNNVACVGDNITKLIQMAQEPWPNDVKLFQPYEVEQILLPDNASCLAVQAFLKMCNLPFEVEMRWNAEFMSPSGRVPFIKCGAFVVSELEPIVQFAANKGVSLCGRLSTEEKAEMRAYMSLITNVLVNAELYISWLDDDTFNAVTKVRNSSVYPWPLGWLQTRSKRNAVAKRLKALHWHDKTLDQVLADVEQCCNSLSQRLGDRDFFFGTPSPLDALVYGHMRALLSAVGPKAALLIKPITSSLVRHVLRMKNLTKMELTPQEDYLVTQAVQLVRRRLSPMQTMSERSTRIKRSKLCLKNKQSKDNVSRDVFGFKPFASKQIIIMTSKEGAITCEYDKIDPNDSRYSFIIDILEDVLDKVEEISIEDTFTIYNDKGDFEVIGSPKDTDSIFTPPLDRKDFLHTIEEDCIDTISVETNSLSNGEDVIQIINDADSDGLVNEKLLSPTYDDIEGQMENPEVTESSVNKTETQATFVTVSSSGDQLTAKSETLSALKSDSLTALKSDVSSKLDSKSSASQSTLKLPSDENMSVQSLLNYLRKRNTYGCHIDADID